MKIKGEYVMREIMGDMVLIPVGETALKFNGMVTMNAVGGHIWQGLTEGKDREALLASLLERFEVSPEEAGRDLDELLQRLAAQGFLEL